LRRELLNAASQQDTDPANNLGPITRLASRAKASILARIFRQALVLMG
jgi:hypothetical protein